jgi:hypothetical protein
MQTARQWAEIAGQTTAGDVSCALNGLQAPERRRLRRATTVVLLFVALCARAAEIPAPLALPESGDQESETKINMKVTDPVSTTWSMKLQNSVNLLDINGHGDQVQDTLTLQPLMPVWLASDLKLITRPKFTLLDDDPYTKQGELRHATGFGDTILDLALSPRSDPWLLGLGPTFVFPTANRDQIGQGKWQIGPAGVAGYRAEKWLVSAIVQQWWSYAGSASRPAVSVLNLQYIASYFLGAGWSIGTSPTIKVDWEASSGNRVTFPFGPALGKVVKVAGELPVKFEIEVLYSPVHPESNGQVGQIQFTVIPVIPGLIHGVYFGE